MSKIVPLNLEKQGKYHIIDSDDYSRFANQQLIPVVAQEFSAIASEFPIVFVKNSETGQFISVAIMGLQSGINLYCQSKQWPAAVTPLGFSNAPLSLVKSTSNTEQLMVCLDEESECCSQESGQALFNAKGEQTPYLEKRIKALLDMADFTRQTQGICQLLAEKQLLTSRQLSVNLGTDKEPCQIDGIYLVDEAKLNKLSSEEFAELRSKGLLPIIYAHLNSLHQIGRLTLKQRAYQRQQ